MKNTIINFQVINKDKVKVWLKYSLTGNNTMIYNFKGTDWKTTSQKLGHIRSWLKISNRHYGIMKQQLENFENGIELNDFKGTPKEKVDLKKLFKEA